MKNIHLKKIISSIILIFSLFYISSFSDTNTNHSFKEETSLFSAIDLSSFIKFYGFPHGPIPEYEKRASIIIIPLSKYTFTFKSPNGKFYDCDFTDTIADIKKLLPPGSIFIPPITTWSQDLFKVIVNKGTLEFILSSKIPSYLDSTEDKIRKYINRAFYGHKITKAPFYFEGGDILFDRINGKSYVFTDSTYKNYDVKDTFKADIEINLPFNDYSIHLDEILLFLGSGRVCVADIKENNLTYEEENRFLNLNSMLSKTRETLSALGYSIVNIPVDYSDIRNGTTHLNCIQFKDYHNRSNIIVPRFYNSYHKHFQQVIDIYKREVFYVHPVIDVLAPFNGSLHCITLLIL